MAQKKLAKKYRKVIEDLGWNIDEPIESGRIMLSRETPAGEDFSMYVDIDNIVTDITDYDYDAEEHIYMLLQAKRSGNNTYNIPSVFVLCANSLDIEDMLDDLKFAINNVK